MCAATPTHYSTEPLTTGPDYDPLLRLLSLVSDVYPNPGPPRYPCSGCFKNVTSQDTSYLCTRCSHWVHSRCSGLRNFVDYRRANSRICTTCGTPTQPHALSPPCQTRRPTYYSGTPMVSETDGTKHLLQGAQRQSGGHTGVQAHGQMEKSQHPELHPSTTGSTARPRRLTAFYP